MERSTTDGMRTLVVGIDAACLPVLEDCSAADAIPTIDGLAERGVSGELESQLPPWTPSAWPSLYTGVNPGKHGVYGFLRFDGYDWDVVDRGDVRERAVWEILSDHGHSSVVLNVPVTHPPNSFDGALVPGYTAPEQPDCHPTGLLEDLRNAIGEYKLYNPELGDGTSATERIDGYEELVELRGTAFRHLVDRFDPDFGFLQFQQTDTLFHEFPDRDGVAERVYAAVDRELDAILEQADPDVVMLVSDHGIGPFDGYEFRANDYLRREGYVETAADGDGMPSWSAIGRKRLRRGEESGDLEQSLPERAMGLASTVGLTAQRMGAVLERLHLDEFVLEHVPTDVVRAASERVDFAESTAYVRDRIELGVRINLEGREPDGVVPPEEYESVRSDLIDAFQSIRTPEGEPLFDGVYAREECFEGPYVDEAPDVVLEPRAFNHYLSASLRGEPFGEPRDAWTHKRPGMVVAGGDGIDETASVEGAHLYDVAPTVLATFGIPAADRMDGDVLPIVDPAGREIHPPFERDPPDATNAAGEDVTDRLSALGYIE